MSEQPPRCPDCGVQPGERHDPNCDVPECNGCGKQRLMCLMSGDCGHHEPEDCIWWGEWPGKKQCRERGWWSVMVPGKGWQPCPPGTPGATEDLNRWSYFRQTGQDTLYQDR